MELNDIDVRGMLLVRCDERSSFLDSLLASALRRSECQRHLECLTTTEHTCTRSLLKPHPALGADGAFGSHSRPGAVQWSESELLIAEFLDRRSAFTAGEKC